ncbi:MAG: hypothetical protein LC122_08775 [Chitinophagales bacterium]|nr:hypothetical protein [Chitinophagales bacterium]
MKYLFFISILYILALNKVVAQYYYNDIVAIEYSNQQHKLLKQNKIRTIKAISKEKDGSIIEDFIVEQYINEEATEVITYSKTSAGNQSTLKSFYSNNKIIKTENEGDGVSTTTNYNYSNDGKLQSIKSTTADTFVNKVSDETHLWFYNSKGFPEKMYRVKNNTDTIIVNFILDEHNLVAEEHWYRKKRNIESYYYYYNDKNLLTDIVRYNSKLKKMLPDFIYEYDTTGKIKKMIQVLVSGLNYNSWLYFYNETTQLKEKEMCYNKQKELLGTIEYLYNN